MYANIIATLCSPKDLCRVELLLIQHRSKNGICLLRVDWFSPPLAGGDAHGLEDGVLLRAGRLRAEEGMVPLPQQSFRC